MILTCYVMGKNAIPLKSQHQKKKILLTMNFESSFVAGCNQIQLALSLMVFDG